MDSNKKIAEVWLKGLKGEQREKMKQLVLNNAILLDKFSEICYNIGVEKRDVSFQDYDSPSWSHKQAHTNGFLECLKLIQDLVSIKER